MSQFLLLTGAALAFALGGVAMKLSAGLTRLVPSACLFLLFCGGAALQALAMRHAGMGVTYIAVLGLEAALAFLLGVWLFSEPATPVRILAVALIAAGILLLRR
ncbi:MAG: SMR family transporter [Acidobacteriota bacterium]